MTWPTKYKNRITTTKGHSFDSKLEAALYEHLLLQKEAGLITDIQIKPNVRITAANILCIPDFSATDTQTGHVVYFESKGYESDVWRIKRRLWKAGYGPGKMYVYKGTYKKLMLAETLVPATLNDELW